jgi:hypothetical protein
VFLLRSFIVTKQQHLLTLPLRASLQQPPTFALLALTVALLRALLTAATTTPTTLHQSQQNAVCRSGSGAVVATADDSGKVKLFRWPCVVKGARYTEHCGHSSHVTNCRFTAGDECLVTVGGNDRYSQSTLLLCVMMCILIVVMIAVQTAVCCECSWC